MKRIALIAAVFLLASAGCAPPGQGSECASSNVCGAGLVCTSCNVNTVDGGSSDAGGSSSAECQHPCTTDNDCTGTSNVHFGSTPRCGQDLCGNHFCTLSI